MSKQKRKLLDPQSFYLSSSFHPSLHIAAPLAHREMRVEITSSPLSLPSRVKDATFLSPEILKDIIHVLHGRVPNPGPFGYE